MNRQVILASRPVGVAQIENFVIRTVPVPAPEPGEILVRNLFLSVEPAMRGWIADQGNYAAPVAIGAVMRSLAVGEIVASCHRAYSPGQIVTGWFGWQNYACVAPDAILRRVIETDLPISLSLGVLGINGVTAHLALTRLGDPKPGQTVVVSTAAGAVGSAVGQIAAILGCRAVGIAGGPEKAKRCVDEFGYATAIDYKNQDVGVELSSSCLDGIDVYFDNTAGAISDAVYPLLAIGARVIVCGTAAINGWAPWPTGPRIERHLLVKRARA